MDEVEVEVGFVRLSLGFFHLPLVARHHHMICGFGSESLSANTIFPCKLPLDKVQQHASNGPKPAALLHLYATYYTQLPVISAP